ncbi:hypothetical protein H5T51_09660 [Candidatus Bathyarchaeota archaeon]|nr:hypothetical protein [Candidatus Bathyarchaeota archaeon]
MKELTDKHFKARLIHLAPIATSLFFGFICSFLILESSLRLYSVTPFPESPEGSIGNALYFLVLIVIGATILLTLVRMKSMKLIVVFTGMALCIAVFFLSIVYLSALSVITVPIRIEAIIAVAVFLTASSLYLIFKTSSRASNLIILMIGGGLGAFLGASIQTLSAVAILCFLAVYDIFAVYRGPVGKIADHGLENLRGLSFSFKEVQMGLGDLTFYSMLAGHMFINFGIIACITSSAGILAGCYLVLRMLEKRRMLPGLPFPISLGLASGFLPVFLLGL